MNHFITPSSIIKPKTKDLGDGFTVRRALPVIGNRMVGPFVFWDHMGPVKLEGDQKLVVRSHPHIGLSTITYLFSGEILHRDSLGNEQYIKPGEVNWMTAGRGIAHSERAENTELEGIQLWVGLPPENEEEDPSFVHKKEAELPIVNIGSVMFRLIAGVWNDTKSPLPVFSDLFYLCGDLKDGQTVEVDIPRDQHMGIYVASGNVHCTGSEVGAYDLAIFRDNGKIEVKASKPTKLMLFGGKPFQKEPELWWNFVSSDKERLEKAKDDWKNGRFPSVINETDFIPLPDK